MKKTREHSNRVKVVHLDPNFLFGKIFSVSILCILYSVMQNKKSECFEFNEYFECNEIKYFRILSWEKYIFFLNPLSGQEKSSKL